MKKQRGKISTRLIFLFPLFGFSFSVLLTNKKLPSSCYQLFSMILENVEKHFFFNFVAQHRLNASILFNLDGTCRQK